MDFIVVGWPAFVFLVGFVVVFSTPVWLAARIVGAKHPTLLRAIASLAVGLLVSLLIAILAGPWGFLLVPVGFLLTFKYILGTSLLGSVLLAFLAALGYQWFHPGNSRTTRGRPDHQRLIFEIVGQRTIVACIRENCSLTPIVLPDTLA